MKRIIYLVFSLFWISCEDTNNSEVDRIVKNAIVEAGGERYENARIDFVFRENSYSSSRKDGYFEFSRTMEDSLGVVKDVLNNAGLKRYRKGEEVDLPDSLRTRIAESVNAVHYFVQLPYGLGDDAVQKKLLGEDTINGNIYHEVKVTFKQEGGGVDHEDEYLYWIQKGDFTVDFLAYRYFQEGGGVRFRAAVNPRKINGIRFVDYENYKPEDIQTPLQQLDDLYEEGKLIKVSQIENEILEVEIQK